jgi:proteasome alpha subunit
VTLPFYASAEQVMRDRSELARKGIARGRSVTVLAYAGGVLFVAENHSSALRKVSEIYDRIGFAAVGRYNEFENLRTAGIRLADVRGYSYDRRDVTGRWLANAYAQTMGSIFTEQQKPFEVELCVAEVGERPDGDQLYRITYDGSITDEPGFVVMGGQTEPISARLRESYREGMELADAVGVAVRGLQSASPGGAPTGSGTNGASSDRVLGVSALEVAILDRSRPRRAFRRITGAALEALLPEANRTSAKKDDAQDAQEPSDPAPGQSESGQSDSDSGES